MTGYHPSTEQAIAAVGLGLFVGVLGVVAWWGSHPAEAPSTPNLTQGPAGRAEVRCIAGYTFVLGFQGTPAQVLDDQGHGVRCTQ